MSIFGATPAPRVPGLSQAERSPSHNRKTESKKGPSDRGGDSVTLAESEGAVRGLAGNDQEEAHEDRQEQRQYSAGGALKKPQERSLDISG